MKRISKSEKDYKRNRARIQKAVRRIENRGYLVPENLIPKIPKSVTPASVRRLEKITIDKIYQKSRYLNPETGEILSGEQGRVFERKTRKKRTRRTENTINITDYVDFTSQVLDNFKFEMIAIFGRNEKLLNYISAWYNRTLKKYGDRDLSEALEKAKLNGDLPGWESVSDTEILVGKLNRILDLIGGTSGGRSEIMEYLEGMEEWEDY